MGVGESDAGWCGGESGEGIVVWCCVVAGDDSWGGGGGGWKGCRLWIV